MFQPSGGMLGVASESGEHVAHVFEHTAAVQRLRPGRVAVRFLQLLGRFGDDRAGGEGSETGRVEVAQDRGGLGQAVDCGHHGDELDACQSGDVCDVGPE